jgi:hypothetical protein
MFATALTAVTFWVLTSCPDCLSPCICRRPAGIDMMLSRPAASRMILCCQLAREGLESCGNYHRRIQVFANNMYMLTDQVKRFLESFLAHKTAVSFVCLHGCKLIIYRNSKMTADTSCCRRVRSTYAQHDRCYCTAPLLSLSYREHITFEIHDVSTSYK